MNLVRSGTKQPQWIFFSAEDKARHFYPSRAEHSFPPPDIRFSTVPQPVPPSDRPGGQILLESTIIQIWFG